ncbi:hypothetical protein BA022_04690 [Diaphorobacter nitroreducens]|nr:hypothetical protein BA022_04690 [Diaphorobacter nitroreducens]
MTTCLTDLANELIESCHFPSCPTNALQRALVHVRDISIGSQAKKMGVVQVTALALGLVLGMSPHAFLDDGDRQTILRHNLLECLPG